MGYRRPQIRDEADLIRFVGKAFIALYLFAVLGLVVSWLIEGGPFWPTAVTAVIVAPLMLAGFIYGKPRALRLFQKTRKDAERRLKGLDIEHHAREYHR